MAGCQANLSGVPCPPIPLAPGAETPIAGADSLRRSVAEALARGASESWFLPQYTPPGPKPACRPRHAQARQGPLRPAGHEPVTEVVVQLIHEGLLRGGSVDQVAEGLRVGRAAVKAIALQLARSQRAWAKKALKG